MGDAVTVRQTEARMANLMKPLAKREAFDRHSQCLCRW